VWQLYNVVVDTDVTSKLLLQRGNLQTRTTIIPLNKISAHVIEPHIVKRAQQIVCNKIQWHNFFIDFSAFFSPTVRSTVRHAIQLQFDVDTNTFAIRAIQV
jgi:hypothetical protein